MQPRTQYAKSGDIHIAYQVFGEGAVDLVFVPGFVSHIENYWDEPNFARWLRRLGNFSRVMMFDKRGTGLSDQVSELPGMDQRMDEVRAVMDGVGISEQRYSEYLKGDRSRRSSLLHTLAGPRL